MTLQKVLIAGEWREANASDSFHAHNPKTREPLEEAYPVSEWADCEAALAAADDAWREMRQLPRAAIANFLERYADEIESRADALVAAANAESALPASPRLGDVELPRTTGQLRQAAAACRSGSWALPTIDTQAGIRSHYAGLGPVCVFGPNNFPFAFNSVAGGDFAAAIAAGNPVIGKANSSHPATTRIFAEAALAAAQASEVPNAIVQLIYRTSHEDGERLVADPRVGATGYTGSRHAGLKLKAAADAAGNPIYLELSSINPVVVLPGAIRQRGEEMATEFTGSCLLGTGQFCTNPGLVMLIAGNATEQFIAQTTEKFNAAPVGTLLSAGVESSLNENIAKLCEAGAELLTDEQGEGAGFSRPNALLRVSADKFLNDSEAFQAEAFGNESLLVVADSVEQLTAVASRLEGNLTGCVYSAEDGSDNEAYDAVAPVLRSKVGRLLNDKMPTGVAVSAAMNHGGPYPATGHPGFTAVGVPGALLRFGALHCYDNVRPNRLPTDLQDKNPTGETWRLIDGRWTTDDVG